MMVSRIKFALLSRSILGAAIAVTAFGIPGNVFALTQQPGQFVEPDIGESETLGGESFGGDAGQSQQLESIDGEMVSGSAGLSEPNLGQYGPVPRRRLEVGSKADQRPGLELQTESGVLSQTEALPNEYEGQTLYLDWMGRESGESQNSSRRTPVRNKPRSVVQPRSKSRLQIDGMKAIETANRDFDSQTHEIVRERYPDGSIKIVRTIAQDAEGNYYNDGGWLMYDRQQRPIASGTYVRGAMEGDWERVHEVGSGGLFSQMPFSLFSGPYLSRANFVRNKVDGVWTISDKDGKLIFSITYENGIRNGLASWFFPTGKKMREATFREGVPHGIVLQWDQQGKMQRREQFVDGRRVIRKKSTYANQTLASERVFRDRKLTPQGSDNWWAAKPATFDRVGDAVQYGPVAEWYPNRQPKMTGRYVDGVRDGLFTWWHESHNKKAEGNFSKGKRVGLWRYWHESGMKRSEGQFEDDKPVGMWREWSKDGRVIDEKTIDSDDSGTEEVIGEKVESNKDSVLDRSDADSESDNFRVDVEDLDSDDPISDGDPFNEDAANEEPANEEPANEEPANEEPGGIGY